MSQPRRAPRIGYIPALDGIRGLLLPGVVLVHYALFLKGLPSAPHWLFHVSFFAQNIQMFFVLSGALITSLLVSEHAKTGSVSLRQFYLRRSRRLGPALVVVLPLVVLAEFAWRGPAGTGPLGPHPLLALGAVAVFFGNWVLFRVSSGIGWLGPAWSLGVEEQFYLSWPLLLRSALRRRVRRAVVFCGFAACAVVGIALASLSYRHYGAADTYYATFTQLPSIIAGCALGYEITTNPDGRVTRLLRSHVVGAVGLVGVVVASYELTRHDTYLYRGGYLVYAAVACMLVGHCFAVAGEETVLTRVLGWRPFKIMGQVSYEAYLIHTVVILAVVNALPNLHVYPMMLLDTAIVAAASSVLYYAVEQPIRRRGWRQVLADIRRSAPATALAGPRGRFAAAGGLLAGAAALVLVSGFLVASHNGDNLAAGRQRAAVQVAAEPDVAPSGGALALPSTGAVSGTAATPAPAPATGQLLSTSPTPQGCFVADCPIPPRQRLSVPTIMALMPATGPILGGTQVTIDGTGFTRGAQVFLGSLRVSGIKRINDTAMTFVMPAASLVAARNALHNLNALHGLQIAVRVRTAAGESQAGLRTLFTYL